MSATQRVVIVVATLIMIIIKLRAVNTSVIPLIATQVVAARLNTAMDGNEQFRERIKAIAHQPGEGLRNADDDAAMRAAIAEHFANVQRNRRGYRRMIAVWAAAAVIALAGVVTLQVLKPQRTAQTIIAAAPGDVDGNGRVDILDAFKLARDIESGDGRGGDNDINEDGIVDARDVDAIAMRAVSLQLSGGQAG